MKMRFSSLAIALGGGALVLTLALTSLGCSGSTPQSEAGTGRWERVEMPLPSGQRMSVYDDARDIIWILTAPHTTNSDAILTEFHPDTRKSVDYTIPGSTNWLGYGDAVAVDGEGRVWAAWGGRLVRFDPATKDVKEWVVPKAEESLAEGSEEIGVAVDTAVDGAGRVWLARAGLGEVFVLDVATGVWDTLPTAGVNTGPFSRLFVEESGNVLLNGLVSQSEWQLVEVNAMTREAVATPAHALGYAVLPDGSVAYLDSDTGEAKLWDHSERQPVSLSPRFSPGEMERDVVADLAGGVWLRQNGHLRKDVVRVDTLSGEVSSFQYPLIITTAFTTIGVRHLTGTPVALDPDIKGMLVDKRGDAWLISGAEGSPEGYPALYRLDPNG